MRIALQRSVSLEFQGKAAKLSQLARPNAVRSLAGACAMLIAGATGEIQALEPQASVLETLPEASERVIILAGDHSMVMNMALDSSVTGNTVNLVAADLDPTLGSQSLDLSGSDNFANLFGVNTIAINSGSAANQNVSVNAAIFIGLGGGSEGGASGVDLLGALSTTPLPMTP